MTKSAKTTGDVVLQEIWRIKDTLSASDGHDVDRLFAEAWERQKNFRPSGRESANQTPQGVTEEEALKKGMEEKSREFAERGK